MRGTLKAIEKIEDLERAKLDLIEATIQFTRPTIRPVFVPLNETWVDGAGFFEEFWREPVVGEEFATEDINLELKPGITTGNVYKHPADQDPELLYVYRWTEPCLFWRRQQEKIGGSSENSVFSYEKCLVDFFKLGSVSNDDFARSVQCFATVWGVLGIWPSIKVDESPGGITLWEPLSLWKETALRVEGILLAFASLSAEPPKPASREDWDKIIQLEDRQEWHKAWQRDNPHLAKVSWREDIAGQRQLLVQTVRDWLSQIHQVPKFSWPADDPYMTLEVNGSSEDWDDEKLNNIYPHWAEMSWRVNGETELRYAAPLFNVKSIADYQSNRFRPSRLFSVITLQLAAILTGRRGVKPCDECGEPYIPKRKNPVGYANICESDVCKKRNAARRTRKKEQKKKAAKPQE